MASPVDAGELGSTDGLYLLLEQEMLALEPGTRASIASRAPRAAEEIASFCRVQGHRFLGRDPDGNFVIERGDGLPVAGGARPERLAAAPLRADPRSGFAPRGAAVEAGGEPFPFDECERPGAWADEAPELYRQATAGVWSVERDLPWGELRPLAPPLERAVGQVMTFLAENELSALYVPAGHLARVHPHYTEVVLFLAAQMSDEARHIQAFTRRAEAAGGTLGYSTAASQSSLKSLMDPPDLAGGTFLLSVLGEGTFLDLLKFIEEHAPDPVTAALAQRARQDETRHVRFGLSLVRGLLQERPEEAQRLSRLAAARAEKLASAGGGGGIAGANRYVYQSLCVLAAGGLEPARLPQGIAKVQGLQDAMHRHRVQRLLACGFDAHDAESLSSGHTPNFM